MNGFLYIQTRNSSDDNFSPQIGSEIKVKHFAIVLTKRDRNSNELLTVIPLTSKYHKHHLDLGDEIKNTIYARLTLTNRGMMEEFENMDYNIDTVAGNLNYVTDNVILPQ